MTRKEERALMSGVGILLAERSVELSQGKELGDRVLVLVKRMQLDSTILIDGDPDWTPEENLTTRGKK